MIRVSNGTCRWRILAVVIAVVAGCSLRLDGMELEAPGREGSAGYGAAPRLVMAFYYPWYGVTDGPGGAGSTVHWGRIDAAKKDIAASTHYPALGAYDSYDRDVIEQHCKWARQAGVDTLISSWWGHGDYTDKPLGTILDICAAHDMTACIYYETAPNPKTAERTAEDIVRVLERYGRHEGYLRVGGKPVVFVYGRAVQQLGLTGWLKAVEAIQQRYAPGCIVMGDQFSYGAARVFDGLHTYNTAGSLSGKTPREVAQWAEGTYASWVDLADSAGKISTITVIPGYDDTKIRTPGLAVERYGGRLYHAQWEKAIKADPHWVVITSFNEWHEGSEIEPSHEDGSKYLRITGEYARRFKSKPRIVACKAGASSISVDEKRALARKYEGKRIAVLADAESMAFWWLLDAGVEMDILSWRDIAAGKLKTDAYAMVLYCAGETYTQTVDEQGDVDKALLEYLSNGGTLVAAPSLPWPFYRKADGEPINNSARFGITLRMGFENPPAGAELYFVQPKMRMKHVPERFGFPESGDLRWRAFVEREHEAYTPLLELRDANGESLGDAVVFAELPNGGKVGYIWFGLLHGQRAEGVLYDAFDFVAGRLD